jgi:hypothetical protein
MANTTARCGHDDHADMAMTIMATAATTTAQCLADVSDDGTAVHRRRPVVGRISRASCMKDTTQKVEVLRWISSGTLQANWALRIDTLTAGDVGGCEHRFGIGAPVLAGLYEP